MTFVARQGDNVEVLRCPERRSNDEKPDGNSIAVDHSRDPDVSTTVTKERDSFTKDELPQFMDDDEDLLSEIIHECNYMQELIFLLRPSEFDESKK